MDLRAALVDLAMDLGGFGGLGGGFGGCEAGFGGFAGGFGGFEIGFERICRIWERI